MSTKNNITYMVASRDTNKYSIRVITSSEEEAREVWNREYPKFEKKTKSVNKAILLVKLFDLTSKDIQILEDSKADIKVAAKNDLYIQRLVDKGDCLEYYEPEELEEALNEATYVYIVHSDINENNIYAEFATEEEALDYARRHKDELTYVDKVEVALDEDGEIIEMFDSETIWVYDEEDEFELEEEVNEFDLDFADERPLLDTRKRTNPWAKPLDYISKEDLHRLDVFIKKVRKNGANKLTKDSVIKFGNKRVLTAGLADCHSLEDVEKKLDPYFDYLPKSIYNPGIEAYDEIVSELPKALWELKTGISVDDEGLDESFLESEHPLDEGINLKNKEEQDEFFRLCDEIGIYTAKDLINFKKEVGCTDDNLLQALRDYRAELGPDFKIANPELERELAMKYEGIDFDALVEELEEFEDEVECRECYGLFPKESCIKGEHGYVCEKCSKTLTESISELTPEQLAEMDAYLRSGKDLSLDNFEEEHADFAIDIVGGELTYNSKTNDFTFYLSIYHASEDNNAEYPEYHTDEEEYSFDTIEEVYDEFPQYLEDIYKWHAGKFSKLEEAKCKDCGGELKDNKCTSCNRDFNLTKCKHCGGEVKDGKCMHCDTKVDMVKCQYCGGEVVDNKCTSCNEIFEEAIKMTRDELLDKEGTDDVELINAGRSEEERVELVEASINIKTLGTEIFDSGEAAMYVAREMTYNLVGEPKDAVKLAKWGETRLMDDEPLILGDLINDALVAGNWHEEAKDYGWNKLPIGWSRYISDEEKLQMDEYISACKTRQDKLHLLFLAINNLALDWAGVEGWYN